MNDMPPQQQHIPSDLPITVTLEAQEWNVVFSALNELPMRVARPVFDKIMSQLQTSIPSALAASFPRALAAKLNGGDGPPLPSHRSET